ncbi:ATP-binding cassette domain-containing protein [Pontibacillus salicampi]|uniref:ATP-binding cassette domain-containing protein n=1 Tax=Pontibacillus salicampi TaxID=1449801 RepID=A0ABV6LM09_9BACI
MIDIFKLTKSYKDRDIFQEATVHFEGNSIHYLMGANGAGKTSLIKCLLGLESYDGTITFDSKSISNRRNEIAVVFDDTPFFPSQSGYSNVSLLSKGRVNKKRVEEFAQKLGIYSLLSSKVKYYSYGEKKKLGLLLAFQSEPSYVILDEISNGLDYDTMCLLQNLLPQWAEHTTILVTGHHYEFYRAMVDRLFVIKDKDIQEVYDFDKEIKELNSYAE